MRTDAVQGQWWNVVFSLSLSGVHHNTQHNIMPHSSFLIYNIWWCTKGKMLVATQMCAIKDNYCLIKMKPRITSANLPCVTVNAAPNYW